MQTWYAHSRVAFAFESAAGLLTVVLMLLFGPRLLFILALLALRPLLFSKTVYEETALLWRMHYQIGKIALAATGVSLLFLWGISQFAIRAAFLPDQHGSLLLLLLVPYFVFIHGLVGVILGLERERP